MNHRTVSVLTAAAALTALGFAYFAQYVLLLTPCELCLWERWPYRLVVVLAVVAVLCRAKAARLFLGIAGAVMLVNVLIAGLHVGVEWGWWSSPLPECNGALVPGQPLPMIPATPCDRAIYLVSFIPVSFAMLDLLGSALFGATLLGYAQRKQRRFK
jgi:disulfide bond formation protein DsbB